jgi:hypothetical protein
MTTMLGFNGGKPRAASAIEIDKMKRMPKNQAAANFMEREAMMSFRRDRLELSVEHSAHASRAKSGYLQRNRSRAREEGDETSQG